MSHLNINGVDKPLDHIRLNNVRSENLFDISTAEDTEYYINDAGHLMNGGYGDRFIAQKVKVTPLIEYTFSWGDTVLGTADNPPYMRISQYANTQFLGRSVYNCIDYANKTFTIITGQSTTVLDIRYDSSTSLRGQTITNLMLNTGSTAKPYEPYFITKEAWEARTRVILHNLTNPLCGIGTYKDTLDLSTGTLTRYIKKLVLTGTETVSYQSGSSAPFKLILSQQIALPETSDIFWCCSHFMVISYDEWGQHGGQYSSFLSWHTSDGGNGLRFKDTEFSTTNDFKQWLASEYAAGHPVTVWYVLATPETETITVPSNLTGIVEGYLTQSSTPSPTSPVYPTANGTTEQGGTYSLDTGAYAIAWGRADAFTGTDPMSARCYGLPIKSWEIDGNTQQDGTPTPDNLIYPQFVGERTENLFDYVAYFSSTFTTFSTYFDYADVQLAPNTTYTFSTNFIEGETLGKTKEKPFIVMNGDTAPSTAAGGLGDKTTRTLTTDSSGVVRVYKRITTNSQAQIPTLQDFQNGKWIMCNVGATALPYEPYGYKIPITSAGQTQTVYLGQVQTTRRVKKRVMVGTENWETQTSQYRNNTALFTLWQKIFNIGKMQNRPSVNTHFISAASGVNPQTQNYVCSGYHPANDYSDYYYIRPDFSTIGITSETTGAEAIAAFKAWLAQQYAAGTPVIVWCALAEPTTSIVNEPLAKIGTYADTLTSEQAGITIPTTDGNNTISVDTSLAPSKMTITGHIRDVWFTQSITGVPPLSFKSNGTPLISLSMKGNGQQNGTPTPDAPIMPTFCGKLIDTDWTIPITNAGQTVPVYLGQVQTVRRVKKLVLDGTEWWDTGTVGGNRFFYTYRSDAASIYAPIRSSHYIPSNVPGAQRPNNSIRQTVSATAAVINIRDDAYTTINDFKSYLAAQYTAGTPVTVWYIIATPTTGIVNEPLAKIDTYADELYSTDAGVSIPTTNGENTLTVDTDLQPSEMTITGYIKAIDQ